MESEQPPSTADSGQSSIPQTSPITPKQQPQTPAGPSAELTRKPKGPSVRRACVACHAGKTKCSDVLPCQNCLKRGQAASCVYPDPDAPGPSSQPAPIPLKGELEGGSHMGSFQTNTYTPSAPQNVGHPQYYQDYNGVYTGASSSAFRPNKRARTLTEEETAAIRNFKRGDFYVGNSAPVRIDPRLPVRLTLAEGDHVHFVIGESLTP